MRLLSDAEIAALAAGRAAMKADYERPRAQQPALRLRRSGARLRAPSYVPPRFAVRLAQAVLVSVVPRSLPAHCLRLAGSTPAKVRKSTIRKSPVTRPLRVGSVGRQPGFDAR